MTPEQATTFESVTKNLNSSQKAQLTSLLAGQAVAYALSRKAIEPAQVTDILRAAAFACHLLSTHATLETLINAATSHDAPPIEVVLASFAMETYDQVPTALRQLQNLLDMIPKESTQS